MAATHTIKYKTRMEKLQRQTCFGSLQAGPKAICAGIPKMHCLPPSDLKRLERNNTPHHQHIQSTIHRKAGIGHSLILPFRVSINCVRYESVGRESGREDEAVLKANERKFGWIQASTPLRIGHCHYGPRQGSELQGSRVNQMIFTPVFTLEPCAFSCPTDSVSRNKLPSIVWGAPVILLLSQKLMAFSCLLQRL